MILGPCEYPRKDGKSGDNDCNDYCVYDRHDILFRDDHGNGAHDGVSLGPGPDLNANAYDTITLGNGDGDHVFTFDGGENTITLGNGAHDGVAAQS